MAEEFALKFENSMKKGFMNGLILSILDQKRAHGYKIKKEIEKRSHGIWEPPISTIYTVLKQMTKNDLITFDEEVVGESGDKLKKVYNLTHKGKETHKTMLESHERIQSSIQSLVTAILGEESIGISEKLKKFSPMGIIFDETTSTEEKIESLTEKKILTQNELQEIDNALKKLKKQMEKN